MNIANTECCRKPFIDVAFGVFDKYFSVYMSKNVP